MEWMSYRLVSSKKVDPKQITFTWDDKNTIYSFVSGVYTISCDPSQYNPKMFALSTYLPEYHTAHYTDDIMLLDRMN